MAVRALAGEGRAEKDVVNSEAIPAPAARWRQLLRNTTFRRVLKGTASIALMVLLFKIALPFIVGAPWGSVADAITGLSWHQVLLLAAIWFTGLYAHTFVLTAAMPRLTHRRALTLSLTGSAVSNLFPCGGALGVGLNYAMSRAWGFSRPAFALYTFVTNLWDVLTKLSLPALALALLLVTDDVTRPQLASAAFIALAVLAGLVILVVAALGFEIVARFFGRWAGSAITAVLRLGRSKRTVELEHHFVELRRESITLLRRAWAQLSLGMIAYSALQALLLWASLHMLGTTLTTPEIFAGYAVERLLTFAVITPGGAGLVEVGITALLIAFGGDPVTTVAGVLIYRAFTFGLEIPVGGAGLLVWLWRRRSLAGRQVSTTEAGA